MKDKYIAPQMEIIDFVSRQRVAYIPDFDMDNLIEGENLVSAGDGIGDPRDGDI